MTGVRAQGTGSVECHDCQRLKIDRPAGRVKWCADGKVRCTSHRAAWLDAQGVWKPAKPVPASVGQQGAFL